MLFFITKHELVDFLKCVNRLAGYVVGTAVSFAGIVTGCDIISEFVTIKEFVNNGSDVK